MEFVIKSIVEEPVIIIKGENNEVLLKENVSKLSLIYTAARDKILRKGNYDPSVVEVYEGFGLEMANRYPDLKLSEASVYMLCEALLVGIEELKKNSLISISSDTPEST
jgi:hypothetical protein